jgi:hypothetical protein
LQFFTRRTSSGAIQRPSGQHPTIPGASSMRATLIATRILFALTVPAAAQPQVTPEQRAALQAACRSDVEKLCPDVQPGGGRIAACMRHKADQASPGCREALAKARAAR